MRRALRIFLFLFLLLFPLAAGALSIGHARLRDHFTTNPSGPNYRLLWLADHVRVTRDTFHPPMPAASLPIRDPNIHLSLMGVGYHYEYENFGGLESAGIFYPRGPYVRYLTLPYWFIFGVASAPLVWRLIRQWLHAARTLKKGLCPKCRYDLRAHKAGDKCPECGNVIAAAFKTS